MNPAGPAGSMSRAPVIERTRDIWDVGASIEIFEVALATAPCRRLLAAWGS